MNSPIVVYANANSILDPSNGAAKSIRFLLEELAKNHYSIYAITGCISDSEKGFITSQKAWLHSKNTSEGESGIVQRFLLRGIRYSLIGTRHWCRRYLAAEEQEAIYRESERVMSECSKVTANKIYMSWGNLLLEEALFSKAKQQGFRTCFYLANPSYKGKKTQNLDEANLVVTDSEATRRLYAEELGQKIVVLPKCVEKPTQIISPLSRYQEQKIYFINPSLNKGLEPFLDIAQSLNAGNQRLKFILVDATKRLSRDLQKLGKKNEDLTPNVEVVGAFANEDRLLEHATIVLLPSIWHESGSRLIHECHLRGIPILAFATGGSREMLAHSPQDLFDPPSSRIDQNGNLRIEKWNENPICARISELSSSEDAYLAHSMNLLDTANNLLKNNERAAKIFNDRCQAIESDRLHV